MEIKYQPYRMGGSALISALFIMTLIAIIATSLISKVQLSIYRTSLIIKHDQLTLAADAALFWAVDRLLDSKQEYKAIDNNGKIIDYPKKLETIYPQVKIRSALYDLQAKFNLNNLQDTNYRPTFYGILEQVLPALDANAKKKIVDATTNFISYTYQTENGLDSWFNLYLKSNPAYYPSHQPMQNSSEFRLVFGVTAKIYQAMLPYITALPEVTPINLLTAPRELLKCLGHGLNEVQVNEIIKLRKQKKPAELFAILPQLAEKYAINATQITLESMYFIVITTTSIDDMTFTSYTVLKRMKDNHGKVSIKRVRI